MPTYSFICRSCKHAYEEFLWYSEALPETCPECGATEADGFGQNWPENRPVGVTYGEDHATTFGQQAKYNAKRVGAEQMQKMAEAKKTRKRNVDKLKSVPGTTVIDTDTPPPLPWWRDGSVAGLPKMEKPLDLKGLSTPQAQEKYVAEGKKP